LIFIENGTMNDGFYFDLVDYSEVVNNTAGMYIVVCHLWEITDNKPEVKDSIILDEARTRVHALGMETTFIGLPGWQGRLNNPGVSLAWFFNNGFYVFEIDDDMMQS